MAICLRYVKDEDEAKDLLQDAFVKIIKSIGQLKNHEMLKSWMGKIVVNQCINYYHHRLKFERKETIDGLEVQNDDHVDVLDTMSTDEILNLINELPDGYRVVFNMYVIEGFSHEEIAEKLSISVVTSRTQLFKARKILKDQLKMHHHEAKRFI